MPTLNETQRALAQLREQRDAAASEGRELSARAGETLARLEQARRTSADRELTARLERELAGLHQARADQQKRRKAFDSGLRERAGELIDVPVEDLVAQLDDHVPVLMFPVRLETKFEPYAARPGVALRVRIFPDDINVSSHDPSLTESERAAGVTYWAERTRALGLDATERPKAEGGAWSLIAARFGGPRARYIARSTQPVGWPAPGAAPAPAGPARNPLAGTPPRAQLLPDFFVVTALDASGNVMARSTGRAIPDRLQMGPDPEATSPTLEHDAQGRLVADDALAWLTDYQRAVDVGMAVTLTLPARVPVARVVAIGMRFSLAPDVAARSLEELLSAHRFTRGIDVVKQGAPTNNTDGAESSFTSALSADEALVEQEVKGRVAVAVLDHASKCDSQRLSEALGIAFESIRDWPSAAARDGAEALAMNRALWPATIGTYLSELVGPRLAPNAKSAIERFFLTYVCGRGLLPAIRVGTQPYGVLATSDLRRWSEPLERGDAFETIVRGLAWFRQRYEQLEPRIAQLGRGDDPIAMTMRVVGQLASSAAYASRMAVTDEWSWNTLKYQGALPIVVVNWYAQMTQQRNAGLAALGITPDKLPLAQLTFFEDAERQTQPVVDQDPELPLSERDGITRFDGTRNYIDWLLTATTAELRAETFKDAAGTIVPAPKALLYRLLHHAWTRSLVTASKDIVARLRPDIVAQAISFNSIVNVGERKVLPDDHAPDVDTKAVGLTQNKRLLGDYVLDLARTSGGSVADTTPEALPLQGQRQALERLAPLATAVLERLLAEHLDTASYRLDAWQTGLVARRLDLMRRREARDKGIYLGAYGYVENLVPKPASTPVDQATIPASLRLDAVISEQAGNGGYVHAPSISHAVTAAVLRNAYLTHSDSTLREAMSVNLSSRRVRTAMSFIEGIRAGQELAALLGYQFERGLHERYPGIELDEFIYVLRARFPLVSRRLTPVPDGTAAEKIEARNVIDGYDMLDHVRGKDYPYAIAGLPAAGSAGALAIVAEVSLLEDALDSVSDLLTAESVHQAVQSNMDRARGALAAVTDGEMPPVPDVVQTPRSGRGFTQRVALHLSAPAGSWTALPTPRALGNPSLNAWLIAQLPAPSDIGIGIRPSGAAMATMTLAASGLEAIDVVLMCGDRIGNGASELERALVDRWRASNAVADDVPTVYDVPGAGGPASHLLVDVAGGAAPVALATVLPQLRSLRRLLGTARALDAQDLRLPSEKASVPDNPKGFALDGAGDLLQLPARIAAGAGALAAEVTALDALLNPLRAAYESLIKDPSTFAPAVWTGPLLGIRTRMRAISLFGAPEGVPRSANGVSAAIALALYEQGRAVVASVAKRVDAAALALAPLPVEAPRPDPVDEARRRAGRLDRRLRNLLDAAKQVWGSGFTVQALFRLEAAAREEIEAGLAAPVESDALRIEAWLQSLARVRTPIAELALACAGAQFDMSREPRLVPVQLPSRAGDPWIAQAWTAAPAAGDVMSVMTVDSPALLSGDLEGLLLDDWTETIPTSKETTGIAFNFDRPNAAAPQALLLATPANADGRWHWEELLGSVTDTFDRARLRAIEPDNLQTTGLFQLLPATMLPFSQHSGLATTFFNREHLATATQR